MTPGPRPIAIGAMRLSTAEDRDDERAGQVLDAALAAGVTLIDTADVYALDDRDLGHNERLVAAAVARHAGVGGAPGIGGSGIGAPGIGGRSVTVVTKGGLVRDGTRWASDGRAQHLTAAALASRERLGGAPIELYLLHAPDPQVPLATSVRALARLVEEGVVRRVGLSNVGRVQLDEALAIADIAAVEVELGPHDIDPIRGGLVARCAERGILLLAHRPLGGLGRKKRWANDRELRRIAERHGATPAEILLAWLRALSPVIVPLPGPTSVATAQSAARAMQIVLDDEARVALDARFLGASAARLHVPSSVPRLGASLLARDDRGGNAPSGVREVVIVMGMPGAGKSTLTKELVGRGYARFNRDERGGTLDRLAVALDQALAEGTTAAVLDNTYPTRASRSAVIDVAARHGLPVRCVWLDTSIEDAQVNAASRLLERYDRLPEPAELNKLAKRDPAAFRPTAQFNWRRELEPPALDEGLASVERIEFVRGTAPSAASEAHPEVPSEERSSESRDQASVQTSLPARPALIVDLDDIVRAGRPTRPDDVTLVEGAAAALAAWAAAGWALAGTSWQPDAAADIAAVDARTRELLAAAQPTLLAAARPALLAAAQPTLLAAAQPTPLAAAQPTLLAAAFPIATCAHPAGPPTCWCRKPMPGLGLLLARRHGLDLDRSVHIGRGAADRGFAERLRMRFADAATFLAAPLALP